MTPVSLPGYLLQTAVPDIDGPTAWLVNIGKGLTTRKSPPVQREVLGRIVVATAVASAALEAVGQLALLAVTLPMIAVKRVVWISLIGCSMLVSGLFWLIHRDAMEIGLAVWIKRLVIHVFLLLRVPSVLWAHLKVWKGLMADHLILMRQITAFALTVENQLSRFFSYNHVVQHAIRARQLTRFAVLALPWMVINPSEAIRYANKLEVGPSRRPSLATRIWAATPSPWTLAGRGAEKCLVFTGNHFSKVLLLYVALRFYQDFTAKQVGPFTYVTELPGRGWDYTVDGIGSGFQRIWRWLLPNHIERDEFSQMLDAMNKLAEQRPNPGVIPAQPLSTMAVPPTMPAAIPQDLDEMAKRLKALEDLVAALKAQPCPKPSDPT